MPSTYRPRGVRRQNGVFLECGDKKEQTRTVSALFFYAFAINAPGGA
jgi:hypothetical protein